MTENRPCNVCEYEPLARARMEPTAWDYYAGGACDERTLAANAASYDRVWLVPRVLVDVSRVDTSSTVLGTRVSMPILLAPTAYHRLAHPEGEVVTARGAGAAGTIMTAATAATRTLEDIAAAATGPLWFQLYVYRERAVTHDLIARAEAAGYRALVLTVDTPVLGRRERDLRNEFALPPGLKLANLERTFPGLSDSTDAAGRANFANYARAALESSLTWESIDWLRSLTRLPIVLKGILAPEDARRAVEAGVDAVIVSNHGGRQLDGAMPSILALPDVVEAVAGAIPVLMDGGIRRGSDVLKALALGASAVQIGRPYLWGLAANGEDGVRHVLELLRAELELAMQLSGCTSIAAIDRSLARPARVE